MNKKAQRRMFWWLEEWQLAEHESWLTAMSADGWHLVKTGIGRATFEQGTPQKLRYRCDIFKAGDWSEQERLELYCEAGWEHVANRGSLQIFRAPADVSIPEIHTDPTEHIKNVRRLLPGRIFSFLFPILSLVFGVFTKKVKLADMLLGTNIPVLFILLFIFGWIIFNTIALFHLIKFIRRIRHRQPDPTQADWRGPMRRARLRALVIALTFILLWGVKLAGPMLSSTPRFPAIPDKELPVPRLEQILDASEWDASELHLGYFKDQGDVFNYYRRDSSILVPEQHSLAESLILGEQNYIYLHCDAYRALSPTLAQVLAADLARERRFYPTRSSLPLSVADDTHGFDGLWVLVEENQQEIIVRQGNWVYHLSFHGSDLSTEHLLLIIRDGHF